MLSSEWRADRVSRQVDRGSETVAAGCWTQGGFEKGYYFFS
jgi:hypothetical protein